MKTIKNIGLLSLLCLSLLMTACKSDDEGMDATDDSATEAGAEFLTATVDGAAFEAAQDPAVIVGAQISSGVLAVQGGKNNGETISIAINNYDGPGTYISGDELTNPNLMQYLTIDPIAAWASSLASAAVGGLDVGTITITSDSDGVVEGTFSFEGYNAEDMTTKMVTEGSFKANLDN